MNKIAARKEAEDRIAVKLVALFAESGVAYTCGASVLDVVRTHSLKLCAKVDLPLPPRASQCEIKAWDMVHARAYPPK